jgi:PAT family beta-lactamase induction signal transducer AmpG
VADPPALSSWESLRAVARSRRLLSVSLLSFSSGLPLGVVWLLVPAWMADAGIDIKLIGLFTLAQAPWTFKVLWAPLLDRYPLPFLGRKRGHILAMQVALMGLGMAMAAAAQPPTPVGLIGALCVLMALCSATQDIAYDAYTVEVLRKEEHGIAVGARVTLYRVAMWVAGRLSITLATWLSWAAVQLGVALLYLPMLAATRLAPEPESPPDPPRSLRQAVWEPLVGLLAQHRALEILAFVVLYKLSDNLTQALTAPFLLQMGYSKVDVGVGAGTVSLVAIVLGTFAGGILTHARGLGPGLWISGLLQIFSNLGYALVAAAPVNRPLMYAAQCFEYLTTGMGNGAFGVLLLRLTERRFSATQYALLSSLFTIPRVLAGPPAGLMADAIGWRDFFVLTLLFGVPGMVMLARFVPWGSREPSFHVAPARRGDPLTSSALAAWSILGGLLATLTTAVTLAALGAIKGYRAGEGFDPASALLALLAPRTAGEWTASLGVLTLGIFTGLAVAATVAARNGRRPAE